MELGKQIEIVIAISFLLLFLPCLYLTYFSEEKKIM